MDFALLIIGLIAVLGLASWGIFTSSFTNRMKHLDKCLHQEVLAVRNKYLVATAILSVIAIFGLGLYFPVFSEIAFLLLCLTLTVFMLGFVERTGDAFFAKLNWAIGVQQSCKRIVGTVVGIREEDGDDRLCLSIKEESP